jgi:hypothetical protein
MGISWGYHGNIIGISWGIMGISWRYHMYVHFHPPPQGGYYKLFRFLFEVYNSARYIIFFKDLFQL